MTGSEAVVRVTLSATVQPAQSSGVGWISVWGGLI